MIWVVTANTNECRIYSYEKNHAHLVLLKEIAHPELKLKTSDTLTTDKPGHYRANDSARGAYSPHTEPKEVEIAHFSKEIAEELDKGRNANAYEKLIIITPPHMNGLLFQHLNKHVQKMVVNNIQKDLQHLNDREIIDFLKTHAAYEQSS
ncbi:MAG TPA: host attachment protein [Gammaproteobacteria bacterium]|jgi:protein required for attachment to host cells|nr:host attachment protein [Gammaproteobacteria bacterium]